MGHGFGFACWCVAGVVAVCRSDGVRASRASQRCSRCPAPCAVPGIALSRLSSWLELPSVSYSPLAIGAFGSIGRTATILLDSKAARRPVLAASQANNSQCSVTRIAVLPLALAASLHCEACQRCSATAGSVRIVPPAAVPLPHCVSIVPLLAALRTVPLAAA